LAGRGYHKYIDPLLVAIAKVKCAPEWAFTSTLNSEFGSRLLISLLFMPVRSSELKNFIDSAPFSPLDPRNIS
jgi:hypothetical protein